jgi:AraC-like DNA-binding protein
MKRDSRQAGAEAFGVRRSADGHESDFRESEKAAESLGFHAERGGQRKPCRCPEDCPHPDAGAWEAADELPIGRPLTIEDVAALLGCSPWTVRQRYLRLGLPYLRTSATGKLIFFREQVTQWILERQEKGGTK